MIDIVIRILSRDNQGHPMGTIVRVSDLQQDPSPPNPNDVFVFVRVQNTPYAHIEAARAALERPVLDPVIIGSLEYKLRHLHKFALDTSQAEAATLVELTTNREVVRNWSVIRPAIIDRASGLVATDAALKIV